MKILHEPFRGKKSTDPVLTKALDELVTATDTNRELNQLISPSALVQELNALQVLDLFNAIQKCDIPLLGMTSENANPANLIVTRVFVPPVCIRPSVVSEVKAGTTEDDLTMKQSEILLINDVIGKHMSTGGKMELIQEDWDFLQLHVALYFNSEVSGVPLAMIVSLTSKMTRGLRFILKNIFKISAEKTIERNCAEIEGETGTISWKLVWQACRFLWTNGHISRSKFNDSSSGSA